MDMPDQVFNIHNEEEVVSCIVRSSVYFDIDPLLLMAIRLQEAGKIGQYSTNKNNTYDVGPMQINVNVWYKKINEKFSISKEELMFDACANVYTGAWILYNELSKLKKSDDIWKAVGNYHSRTPKHHNNYVMKVKERYNKLLKNLNNN